MCYAVGISKDYEMTTQVQKVILQTHQLSVLQRAQNTLPCDSGDE